MSLAKISLYILVLCVAYRAIDAGKLKIFQPKNELQKQFNLVENYYFFNNSFLLKKNFAKKIFFYNVLLSFLAVNCKKDGTCEVDPGQQNTVTCCSGCQSCTYQNCCYCGPDNDYRDKNTCCGIPGWRGNDYNYEKCHS